MIYPVEIKKITSAYGERKLPGREPVFHDGVDFSGKNKFALAVCNMRVEKIVLPDDQFPCKFRFDTLKGFYVPDEKVPSGRAWTPYIMASSVDYPDITFIYKHVRAIVEKGLVSEGDKIGEIGNYGFSMGPHLHFEVHRKGEVINPIEYLNGVING